MEVENAEQVIGFLKIRSISERLYCCKNDKSFFCGWRKVCEGIMGQLDTFFFLNWMQMKFTTQFLEVILRFGAAAIEQVKKCHLMNSRCIRRFCFLFAYR